MKKARKKFEKTKYFQKIISYDYICNDCDYKFNEFEGEVECEFCESTNVTFINECCENCSHFILDERWCDCVDLPTKGKDFCHYFIDIKEML